MSDVLSPVNFPDLYDHVVIAGQRSPGEVEITGHDADIDWDVKVAPGFKGATTTLKGIKPIEFTVTFILTDDEDFEAWPAYAALIRTSVQPPKPKALDIYHPDLVAVGVSSAVLKTMGGVVHDKKGGQRIAVKFIQYFPPKPAPVTPSGSTTNKKAPDPDAAALAELDKLVKQNEKTEWK